ncbi:MAG TPA: tyrosine-protein phosphatase [Stackebrandtia sp.]|uniref:tyrosine-protein phosphatase n=1 Tax=Stackebrandtia sp. TaxID=2023065 RepID=UPI002D638CD0|nr:tyrosine-protein phosphatase [Stackebrandtia sp.]HZE37278.1 tyrosine-protein phosphatase [Stackebrandtia sp.]
MNHPRHIRLDGSPNLRDLGGHLADDGRKVAYGQLFRSGELSRLSDADLDVVGALKLRTVLDFRIPAEQLAAGVDRLPEGLTPVALPVGGGSLERYYALARSPDPATLHRTLGDGQARRGMLDIYRCFVAGTAERAQFATALRTIAAAPRLPLLFHCTAGKDRTGWMSAIVLRLLGVPREDILADYMLSNEYFGPVARKQLAALSSADIDAELFAPLVVQHADYLAAAFDEADARFGDFASFVHKGLDVDAATVANLRDTLLTTA